MKLRKTVTNDRSAPRLEKWAYGPSQTPYLHHLHQDPTEKGENPAAVIHNTAGNAGIVEGSRINTHTRLDLTGNGEIRGPLKIRGECQPSNAKDAYKFSPKILSIRKQRLFQKSSTSVDQVQSLMKNPGDTPNGMTTQGTANGLGAPANKENSNPARKFFNSLRSKKSLANLGKNPDIATMPDTADLFSSPPVRDLSHKASKVNFKDAADLFFNPPSKDLSHKASKANVKDAAMGKVQSPFDQSPAPVNPVSQPTDPVSHVTAPISRAANPAYGLSTAKSAQRPPQSLGTAHNDDEKRQRLINSILTGKADLSPRKWDAGHDEDDSSEEEYTSPEAATGSSSMLSTEPEQEEEPEFEDEGNAVKQLTNLYIQNYYGIGSTRELLSPEDQAALGLGNTTGSDGDSDPGAEDANLTEVETTTGSSASITDAACRMLDMSRAIDELHAAAEAADGNTTGHCVRSPRTATEEQKKNYSAGMVIPPVLI